MRFIEIRSFIFWSLLCLYTCVCAQASTQQIPDSLAGKSYKYLYDHFYNSVNDTLMSKLYLNAYLEKATKTNDGINKSLALNLLSNYESNDNIKLKLIEKSIVESNSTDSSFSVSPYNTLGTYYYKRYAYEEAFQQFSKVLELSKRYNNNIFEIYALHNIALVRSEIGQHREA